MSEDNEEKKLALEIYKNLNDRVNNEISELYTIHSVFLIIAGALIALTAAKFGNRALHIIIGIGGMVIACLWYKCITAQEEWKNWWIKEAAIVEGEINSFRIWRKIVVISQTRNPSATPKAQSKNNNIEHPPPQPSSISNLMHIIPEIFGLASLASFIFGIRLFSLFSIDEYSSLSSVILVIFVLISSCFYSVRQTAINNMYNASIQAEMYARYTKNAADKRDKEEDMYKEIVESWCDLSRESGLSQKRNCFSTMFSCMCLAT